MFGNFTDKNYIQGKIMNRLSFGNLYYHAIQKIVVYLKKITYTEL